MVIKINKQKLVMEQVELFDNISIEELADGVYGVSSLTLNSSSDQESIH